MAGQNSLSTLDGFIPFLNAPKKIIHTTTLYTQHSNMHHRVLHLSCTLRQCSFAFSKGVTLKDHIADPRHQWKLEKNMWDGSLGHGLVRSASTSLWIRPSSSIVAWQHGRRCGKANAKVQECCHRASCSGILDSCKLCAATRAFTAIDCHLKWLQPFEWVQLINYK